MNAVAKAILEKRRRAQQQNERPDHADEVDRCRLMGLFELGRRQDQDRRPDDAEQDEIGAPAAPFGEIGADRGRQRGCEAHHHHDRRQGARRALAVVDVAHDRPAQHHPGAAAQRLERAADDQDRQRPGEPAQHRAGEKQRKSGDQHRSPPEAIGDRAVNQLPRRDAGEKQGQHQLDGAGCGVEHHGEQRQRRHQHVQRRRRNRGDQGQEYKQRSAPGHRQGKTRLPDEQVENVA